MDRFLTLGLEEGPLGEGDPIVQLKGRALNPMAYRVPMNSLMWADLGDWPIKRSSPESLIAHTSGAHAAPGVYSNG